jgi:N-acyl-D-amino-acid deacylase
MDTATYEKPHQYARGVEYVVVTGRIVQVRGKHTGARREPFCTGPANCNSLTTFHGEAT